MCIQMLGIFLNGVSGQEITFKQPFLQAATPSFLFLLKKLPAIIL